MSKSPIIVGLRSDVGAAREINEDACTVAEFHREGEGALAPVVLAVVADGVGGHAAGEVASRTAVAAVAGAVSGILAGHRGDGLDPVAAVEAAFEDANAAVHELAQTSSDLTGMGTTLVVALVFDHRLCVGHVGDSRAYLIRRGEAWQLTRDHTVAQDRVDAGIMTPQEADDSVLRSQLTRVVGTRPSVEPDVTQYDLQDGDVVVLCSDGLYNTVGGADLARIVAGCRDAQSACDSAVGRAKALDGGDNITAVCMALGETAFASEGTHPMSRLPGSRLLPRRRILGLLLGAVIALMFVIALQLARQAGRTSVPPGVAGPKDAPVVAPAETAPISRTPVVDIMVELQDGRARVPRWRGSRLLSVTVGGGHVSGRGARIDAVYGAPPFQRVELSVVEVSQGRCRWTLTRRPEVRPESGDCYVWFDGRQVRAAHAPLPKERLQFFLAGAQGRPSVPVVINLSSPSARAVGAQGQDASRQSASEDAGARRLAPKGGAQKKAKGASPAPAVERAAPAADKATSGAVKRPARASAAPRNEEAEARQATPASGDSGVTLRSEEGGPR